MIHQGKNTRSRIVSKGISAGKSMNCYRGLVQIMPSAHGARNHSQCDSMLIGDQAGANTYPYIQVGLFVWGEGQSMLLFAELSDQLFYFFPGIWSGWVRMRGMRRKEKKKERRKKKKENQK